MKNIIKILLSLLVIVSFDSCSDGDNTVDDVLDIQFGAVLRTVEVLGNSVNSSVPSSSWGVIVEEQDHEDGALLQSVTLAVSLRDLTPDNGFTALNTASIRTYDASEFSTDTPFGLPRITISTTFGEAIAAMGIVAADTAPGDLLVFDLILELTDGRIFDASNAGGIITGGFFSSPFTYSAIVSCTPEPGTYTLDMQDSYGDGWQSDGIGVTIDGVTTNYRVGDNDNLVDTAAIVVPVGTSSLTWEWFGDSFTNEVTFQIYAPDGTLLGIFKGTENIVDYGNGSEVLTINGVDAVVASTGLLPILLCAGG